MYPSTPEKIYINEAVDSQSVSPVTLDCKSMDREFYHGARATQYIPSF